MVVEVAGGNKDPEKQPIDSEAPLPGWTPNAPAAPPAYVQQQATVKSCQRSRGRSCCGVLFLLMFVAMIGLTIYFGVMSCKYRRMVHDMKKQCKKTDGLWMPDMDWPNRKPHHQGRPDGDMDDDTDDDMDDDMMGGHDDKWNRIAARLARCINVQEGETETAYSIDAGCLKIGMMGFIRDIIGRPRY